MDDIFLKRFSRDKQEQIRQFVSYAQMMGLSGKDIRSIGDKIDRIGRAELRKQNLDIVAGYECLPIGRDGEGWAKMSNAERQRTLDSRFKLKTARGAYNFYLGYDDWDITSLKTKANKRYHVKYFDYELCSSNYSMSWARQSRYALLLDINSGKLLLDF